MKTLKSLFLCGLFALCALALPTRAHAQFASYGPVRLDLGDAGGTFGISIAGSAATNVTAVIDCRKNLDTAVQLTFSGDAAGTANVVAYFKTSVDGVSYDSTRLFSVGAAANGTTAVTFTTNITQSIIGGFGYMKLAYITNAAASGNVTNLTMRYAVKR